MKRWNKSDMEGKGTAFARDYKHEPEVIMAYSGITVPTMIRHSRLERISRHAPSRHTR